MTMTNYEAGNVTVGSTLTSKSGWCVAEILFIYPDGSYRTKVHNWKFGGTRITRLKFGSLKQHYPVLEVYGVNA